jgi:hypothetical protein
MRAASVTEIPTHTNRMDAFAAEIRTMKGHADRFRQLRWLRMQRIAEANGIALIPIHVLGNALISAEAGRPWTRNGVAYDTDVLRQLIELDRTSWEADRIVGRWYNRVYWHRLGRDSQPETYRRAA